MTPAQGTTDSGCSRSGRRICIAGTGGQGVLTAARLLCDYFAQRGHEVVSGQLHGMAQRGGSVQSCVIIDRGISPVIGSGRADVVLGFEPVETARALPLMSAQTVVYMNTCPVVPFVIAQQAISKEQTCAYPEVADLVRRIQAVTDHLFTCDATAAAAEAGSTKALNMVMLGCLLGSGVLPVTPAAFWDATAAVVPAHLAQINAAAFWNGAALVEHFKVTELKP